MIIPLFETRAETKYIEIELIKSQTKLESLHKQYVEDYHKIKKQEEIILEYKNRLDEYIKHSISKI